MIILRVVLNIIKFVWKIKILYG